MLGGFRPVAADLTCLCSLAFVCAFLGSNDVPAYAMQAAVKQSYSQFLILRKGSQDVGCILAWLLDDELQILDLAVHPAHRRHGHGEHLLKSLIALAKQSGCATAMLEVSTSNIAAIILYERTGFSTVHARRKYYKDGSDALLMNLVLRP